MTKLSSDSDRIVYIPGDQVDRDKWDRCIEKAMNGNICGYSWFLDIMAPGWGGLIKDDYMYVMPVSIARRFGINYLLQPRFIQQCGVFGLTLPDAATISVFLNALPHEIRVIDYHFNEQNSLPSGLDVEMRTNFLLKTDKTYEELKLAYNQNLVRKLRKSVHSGFHIIINNNPEPLIKLFREENGKRFSFLKNKDYTKLAQVFQACIHRDKAKVWSVYNSENVLCGGAIWLFSHGRAILYFSVQSKNDKAESALAWLIDAFIKENSTSGILIDFEGSIHPGLARFYGSFGSVAHFYPRLKVNHFSPFMKIVFSFYRKLTKD
jgi:hypothetical protein